MKISYGIYQDLKGTPYAVRSGHFVQCYALRYPRASSSLVVPAFDDTSHLRDGRPKVFGAVRENIMAHGVSEVLGEGSSVKMVMTTKPQPPPSQQQHHHQRQPSVRKTVGVMGSRRIFPPAFKLKVLDSYRNDTECRGNQRATARKYGIHRRQIQKWLQCEENLRKGCAESSANLVSMSATAAATIAKSESSVPESSVPGVTSVSPALNLSLARLHGDELAVPPQGPPPPPHQPCSSPTVEYAYQKNASLHSTPIAYADYPGQEQIRRNHHYHHPGSERDDKRVVHEMYEYQSQHAENERKYYVVDDYESGPVMYSNRGEMKLYQSLGAYHSPLQDRRYEESGKTGDHRSHYRHHTPHHRQHHRNQQSYEELNSSPRDDGARALMIASTEIKTERASPDSAATPGPYEPAPGSPGAKRGSLPSSHYTATTNTTSSVLLSSSEPASPLVHSHVQERAHALAASSSEKSRCQEREQREASVEGEIVAPVTTMEALVVKEEEKEDDGEAGEEEEATRAEPEEATTMKKEGESTDSESERDREYGPDYQRPPATSSSLYSCVRAASPVQEQTGASYSGPSSPQGPESSCRSSSNCSDSDADADFSSPAHRNASGDLARRRSFSLRFKLDVLDAFHRDVEVAGNQRATAKKFGINRRQVQKWLGQEAVLRDEIAFRGGNSRQRLGPAQDTTAPIESPVDLRTKCLTTVKSEFEFDRSPQSTHCCDLETSPHNYAYCHPGLVEQPELAYRPCSLSCCVEGTTVQIPATCYADMPLPKSCYAETQNTLYCYSPRDTVESMPSEGQELVYLGLKRPHCGLSCCYEVAPSPKKLCLGMEENRPASCHEQQPPQDAPLCLVKPKSVCETSPQTEPVSSTVPTPPAPPPAAPSSKKDAILFKPYLDNPISKPTDDSAATSNNNNCQGICNLNEDKGQDYALKLNLRVPVAWRTQHNLYAEFPRVKSAFVRYPASPHYT